MREHQINKLNNFISGWYLNDTDILLDKLIEYHTLSDNKTSGLVNKNNGDMVVDVNKKESTDCILRDDVLFNAYLNKLKLCVNLYKSHYPFVDRYSPWGIIEPVNIQHYKPNTAYHAWHTERTNAYTTRHMVFMTYLNGVTDGGETEFYHQNIKVKPEKGLTLIWPADWTFTHRGIPSTTQEKYVITGWFSYIK